MLTEASLCGAADRLVGLKENVIRGHLIPAGTAFKPHLDLRVKHLAEPPEPKEETVGLEPATPPAETAERPEAQDKAVGAAGTGR